MTERVNEPFDEMGAGYDPHCDNGMLPNADKIYRRGHLPNDLYEKLDQGSGGTVMAVGVDEDDNILWVTHDAMALGAKNSAFLRELAENESSDSEL